MPENKMQTVSPDDPARCQARKGRLEQCHYRAVEGSTYCTMHGGHVTVESSRQKSLRNYRLQKWQDRVSEFADANGVKSLREEIGILRILMEEMITKCKDDTDLLLFAPRIADLVMKIEKVVVSCTKLETQSGMLLDKSTALALAGRMVEIISRRVTDPEAVDAIANEIAAAILGTKDETENQKDP